VHQFTLKRPPVQPRLGLRADNRRSYWDTYRPTTLSEVMGQDAAVDALRGFLAAPYPVALLFSGDTGTGKTSAALALANDLGVNLAADFFHVKSGGADLDTFEEIARLLRFTPWCGWRLILIDEADQATARARQLMLSMLESLPPRTVLVMTTNHPEKFDTRTRDRMVELPFVADSVEGAQRLADAIWHAETGGEDGPSVDTLPGVFEAGKLSFRRVVGAMQALVRDGLRPLPALSGGSPEPEEAPAPAPDPEPVDPHPGFSAAYARAAEETPRAEIPAEAPAPIAPPSGPSPEGAKHLERIRNRATLYELAISRGDETFLVAYCQRKSRDAIFKAVAKDGRREKLVALTGDEEIRFAKRTADGATMGAWAIRFTGRTEREAIASGTELPYVGEWEPTPDPTPDPDFREEAPAEAIPPVSGGAPVADAEAPPLEADESIVVVEELPAFVAMVKLAADEPRRLRSCDVDRVMLAAVQAFSLPTFNRFAAWLATIDLHETTRDKVKGWVYEADEAEAPTPPTDFPDAPTLTIAGKPYAYEAFTGPDGFRVVRLTKADGTTYDVAEGADRVTCECPHFVNRLFELQGRVLCKHVVAALAAGLVAQPDPDRHLPGDGDEDDARETFPATPDPAADPGPRIPIPARKLPPLSRPYRPDPAPETDPTPEAVFEDHGITLHEPEPIGHPCNVTTADAGAPAIGLQALVVACHGHTRPMSVEVAAHAQDASWAILGAIAELRDDRAEQEQPRPPQDSTEGADSPGISRVEQEDPPATLFGEGPRRGRLTLIQLVEAEADRFLARRNGAGKLMAQALEALAEDIRWTRAETPWEHESRLQLFDEWADENAPAEAR
jgi:hypothetical protein